MPHEKTKSDNDDSHARSAKAQKAEEVQRAGSAKAGAGHAAVPEGGSAPAPIRAKGEVMPASSTGDGPGSSPATAGKAEKEAAHRNAELTKDQHGRGHRKEH